MSKADDVLKRQTLLSQWSGTGRVAAWLMVLGVIVLAGSAWSALQENENILRAVVGPLFIIAAGHRMKMTARLKCRELELGLS